MRNIFIISLIISVFMCCSSRPNYFSNYYTGQYTGLDTLIDIQGYYVSPFCDSSAYYMVMFYNNGLLLNARTSDPDNKYFVECFNGQHEDENFEWGCYEIHGDTIKTQTCLDYGPVYGAYTIFRDYLIGADNKLQQISDYLLDDVKKQYLNKWKYGKSQFCQPSSFHPLASKRDSSDCELLKKKWFYKKDKI
ncbi:MULTISPECIES: hypothetical protein [unclassified Dysgonomonas]|uniref:hypothetical protein n=1 Tax=unclassified Dysgonomonas TaxID=2630389 RepID=UPI002473C467|nr:MULTISPECIES: hypothetical protein [unclassified Dysgonomonas]